MSRRVYFMIFLTCFCWLQSAPLMSAEFETIYDVEKQPLAAATERLIEALQYIGAPLSDEDIAKFKRATRLAVPALCS